jgi:DNA-cytosine methyltransferase
MKVLSLFDGISIAQQALKELNIPVEKYYASEIDKYAIKITQNNFPNTIQLGDVRNISINNNHFIDKDIDLLIGGSPCQDLSIAKKGRDGLAGSRSGLFFEYARILKEFKPKYFVLENVNSMPKEAKEIITKELFGIEPIMINASLVSAQNRKRLFWIGKLVGDTYKQVKIEQPKDKGILLRDILEPKVDERYYIKEKSNTIRVSGRGSGINDRHNWDTIRIGQIGNGGQGDRIYSQKGKSVTLSANGGEGLINLKTQQIRKLTPIECERLQSLPDNYTEGVSNTQRYKALGNGFNCEVIKHILTNLT